MKLVKAKQEEVKYKKLKDLKDLTKDLVKSSEKKGSIHHVVVYKGFRKVNFYNHDEEALHRDILTIFNKKVVKDE